MRAEKIRALVSAMRWLEANHQEILAPKPNWIRGVKRIAEACALAQYIKDGDLGTIEPFLREHADEWITGSWRILRNGEFFADAIDGDSKWVSLAMNYVPFYRHGLRNERLERLIVERVHEVEDAWFIRLALACALQHMGIPSKLDIDALTAECWAMRLGGYQWADPPRAYETTHVAMWLADLKRLPPTLSERLREWSPAWMESYRNVSNPDVLAELVMMAHYYPPGCASEDIWKWLLSRQDPDGSFPQMDIPSRALGRYHATVVAAIALAVCLGKNCNSSEHLGHE
jgi:hypothetical protein